MLWYTYNRTHLIYPFGRVPTPLTPAPVKSASALAFATVLQSGYPDRLLYPHGPRSEPGDPVLRHGIHFMRTAVALREAAIDRAEAREVCSGWREIDVPAESEQGTLRAREGNVGYAPA